MVASFCHKTVTLKMADQEIELKLTVDAKTVAQLRQKLRGCQEALAAFGTHVQTPKKEHLRSIYFDTADHRLARAKIALRIRRERAGWVQTVKVGRSLENGLSKTRELNARVPRPTPLLDAISDEAVRAAILSSMDGAKLIRVFETRMQRFTAVVTQRLTPLHGPIGKSPAAPRRRDRSNGEASGNAALQGGQARIECALDDGVVTTLGAALPLREVELEMKDGPTFLLLSAAEALLSNARCRPSQVNKAEAGYRLRHALVTGQDWCRSAVLSNEPTDAACAVFSRKAAAAADDDLATALSSIGGDACRQIIGNWQVVCAHDDPEGPHQLRVGLRRLRTAIRLFEPLTDTAAMRTLCDDARDLGRVISPLRDADVLLAEIIAGAAARELTNAEAAGMRAALQRHQSRTRAEVRGALEGPAWTRLKLNALLFDLAVERAMAHHGSDPHWAPAGLQKLARKALAKRWRRVARWGGRLADLSIEERHEMRKDLKGLRYGVEFLAPCLPGADEKRPAAKLLKHIKPLQDVFGYLNDVASAQALPRIVAANHACAALDPHQLQGAAAKVIAHHEARAEAAWCEAQGRWEALDHTPKPWD